MNRNFHAGAPNEPRLADITGFGPPGGKACLPSVPDCFDGAPAAWPIGTSPDAEPANGGLEAACGTLSEGRRPVTRSPGRRRSAPRRGPSSRGCSRGSR